MSWDESLRERLTARFGHRAGLAAEPLGNRTIVGHDGDTIGQSAYLRIDPEAGIAACLLTNSAESETLYREVFSEVFGA